MSNDELIKNYMFWCMGKRDVFSDFKCFSRTIKFEKFELEGDEITYEIVEFKDKETTLYAVVNDFVTLYVTRELDLAISTYLEFITTIQKLTQEEH
ncbi:hypothetical protein [Erysipelothrix tonsillarum]|uniref:hypothetical protein n=2 Tax=Erysipelothrix TaxID=1647 RepID=UPI000370C57A|nr:hypothetical protein [Erysipelothrix tonsillarum]MDE8197314.1 hypothetical protein [Erysipelothrix rhusiopathiae]MDE8220896.1 hypothetical protein [Erysipelothrix rhusiopathiae]MDE8290215.1 hypothetical protein [Erysipelothrix rhusiopathiae]MDE9418836.1 hypothetical protein [Erysipelothrix rhusiopathiae]